MEFNPQLVWIAVAAVAALVAILLVVAAVRRSRTASLREHFGSEYDRTVEARGSRTDAEEELAARAREVKELDIHPLTAAERERYTAEWRGIERRFVERPTTAVVEADELIASVMRSRGYPMADFEKHAAQLSVSHPRVVEHYRAGHAVLGNPERGAASTEELRQAMLHYRSLFEELAGADGDVVREIAVSREIEDRDVRRDVVAPQAGDELRPR